VGNRAAGPTGGGASPYLRSSHGGFASLQLISGSRRAGVRPLESSSGCVNEGIAAAPGAQAGRRLPHAASAGLLAVLAGLGGTTGPLFGGLGSNAGAAFERGRGPLGHRYPAAREECCGLKPLQPGAALEGSRGMTGVGTQRLERSAAAQRPRGVCSRRLRPVRSGAALEVGRGPNGAGSLRLERNAVAQNPGNEVGPCPRTWLPACPSGVAGRLGVNSTWSSARSESRWLAGRAHPIPSHPIPSHPIPPPPPPPPPPRRLLRTGRADGSDLSRTGARRTDGGRKTRRMRDGQASYQERAGMLGMSFSPAMQAARCARGASGHARSELPDGTAGNAMCSGTEPARSN